MSVYVNDTLIYSGSNLYQSRDYRYLGTIGYFDKIYLPPKSATAEILSGTTDEVVAGLLGKIKELGLL